MFTDYEYDRLSDGGKVAVLTMNKVLDGLPLAEARAVIELVTGGIESNSVYRAPTFAKQPVDQEEIVKTVKKNIAEVADKVAAQMVAAMKNIYTGEKL